MGEGIGAGEVKVIPVTEDRLRGPAPRGSLKFTAAIKAELVELLRQGVTVGTARRQFGIDQRTYYLHLKNDATFRESVARARAGPIGKVETALFKAASEPDSRGRYDWNAMRLFLTNRAPDRWRERPADLELDPEEVMGEVAVEVSEEEARAIVDGERKEILGLLPSEASSS